MRELASTKSGLYAGSQGDMNMCTTAESFFLAVDENITGAVYTQPFGIEELIIQIDLSLYYSVIFCNTL